MGSGVEGLSSAQPETAAGQGSLSHSLLQDSHSCSTKAKKVLLCSRFWHKMGVWAGGDGVTPIAQVGHCAGHRDIRGWLQQSHTNFMTLSQSLQPPISLNKQPLSFLSVLPVWITDF